MDESKLESHSKSGRRISIEMFDDNGLYTNQLGNIVAALRPIDSRVILSMAP